MAENPSERQQTTLPANLVVVPRIPTKTMLEAATNAMRKRQEEMGEDWFPVSNKVKARIRWEAMLAAWELKIMTHDKQTTDCPTCGGEARILHVYSRGPTSPPGNQWIGCPDCEAGRVYSEMLRTEIRAGREFGL